MRLDKMAMKKWQAIIKTYEMKEEFVDIYMHHKTLMI